MQDLVNIYQIVTHNPMKCLLIFIFVPFAFFIGSVFGFVISAGIWSGLYYFITTLNSPDWLKFVEVIFMLVISKIFILTSTLIGGIYSGYKMLNFITVD